MLAPNQFFEGANGEATPAATIEQRSNTAWALLDRVREAADPQVVARVLRITETDGIDDIAELWAGAEPVSLAGQLWRLYRLREAIAFDSDGITAVYRMGAIEIGTIDPVVAGAVDPATPENIRELSDIILRGAFTGDFALALERAASFCKVLAHGATRLADRVEREDARDGADLTRKSLRYSELAEQFALGANYWRLGKLS